MAFAPSYVSHGDQRHQRNGWIPGALVPGALSNVLQMNLDVQRENRHTTVLMFLIVPPDRGQTKKS